MSAEIDAMACRRALDVAKQITLDQALQVERELAKPQTKDQQEAMRIGLLGFYASRDWATPLAGLPTEEAIRNRRAHIIWMLKETPGSLAFNLDLGLFQINTVDDPLADPQGYAELEKFLLRRFRDEKYRFFVSALLGLASPTQVEKLLQAETDRWALARMYALALQGVRAQRSGLKTVYGQPLDADFYRRAATVMETTRDQKLLSAAADYKPRSAAPSEGEAVLVRAAARAAELYPPPKLPAGPVPVGGSVMATKWVNGEGPRYPQGAREQGIQGTVQLSVIISELGAVEAVEVLSGPPELRAEAERCVRTWTYQPIKLNNQPIKVRTKVDVNFALTP